MEACVNGVSTRSVDDLVAALGVESGISKSEVSRICGGLDEQVEAFPSQPHAVSGCARGRARTPRPPNRRHRPPTPLDRRVAVTPVATTTATRFPRALGYQGEQVADEVDPAAPTPDRLQPYLVVRDDGR
jgi:hypothetical protein